MAENVHATAVLLDGRGVLIRGPSGSGKTGLALALIVHIRAASRAAKLVADDQSLVESQGGRLVATAPPTIAGLVEVRGYGVRSIDFEPSATIDLIVDLVPAGEEPRLSEGETATIAGCEIPLLRLASRQPGAAVFAVSACLGLPPFA